jgi:hypothetical protein
MAKLVEIPKEQVDLTYVAEPTAREFHRCGDFVRGIMGPVGSGKTTACIMELYTRALEQKPFNGVRRSRWALIRNTYPELLSTTLKTFEEWIPREICPVVQSSPIRGTLRVGLPDGTRVEAEFLFLALDQEEDTKKLRSLELTGAFINEASEIRKSVLDMLTTRVDRYPNKATMGGITWTGIIMDTNPPNDGHWWYKLAEIEKPKGYRFWKQPPALLKGEDKDKNVVYLPNDGSKKGIPKAENIDNHNSGFDYYFRMIPGKDPEFIKVFVLGEYGSVFSGKCVYPEYSDTVHHSDEELMPYRGLPLILAWDFGLTPACVIMQLTPGGQLRILDELVSEDMGIERFARDIVSPFLAKEKYQGMAFQSVGDPAGRQRSQANEVTCMQMLEMQGFRTEAAPTNDFIPRRESVAWFLTKMVDGEPGMLLSNTCEIIRKGFMGGYQYRRMKASGGGDKFAETPDKNEFSHPHDCVQYGCSFLRSSVRDLGIGGFNNVMGGQRRTIKRKNFGAWS